MKSGRTHLQDATPIRLGQEFAAYGHTVRRHRQKLEQAAEWLREMNIGGTAVGTGINAEPEYAGLMVKQLEQVSGLELRLGQDLVQLMQSMGDIATLSGALRAYVLDLNKIANDIRLLASGPRTGLAEILLPAVQPGSSIMPGKVNPSIAEMVNQVCYQALGLDTTVALAAEAGQLELNVMMPVMAHNIVFCPDDRRECQLRCWPSAAWTESRPMKRSALTGWSGVRRWSPRWRPRSATPKPPSWPRKRLPAD